jgi:deoxyribodipyrimidine photo-lyase
MTEPVIQETRIQQLNDLDLRKGRYVLYWMQQSQRVELNHALEYAIHRANELDQSVLVGFGLTDDYPEANLRHYSFMLEGLGETQKSLKEQGIKFVIQKGRPAAVALKLGAEASLIVCDRGYLRHQKDWRREVAREADCRVVQVETDVVVPVEVVSGKAEYAARTIRPKVTRHLRDYLKPVKTASARKSSLKLQINGLDLTNLAAVLKSLKIDRSVAPVGQFFKGGTSEGKKRFQEFLRKRFEHYVENRNQPQTDDISHMSLYLHFGQISPLYLALTLRQSGGGKSEDRDSYLEELIVRRELAMNFANYTPDYDRFSCLPDWARKTLAGHEKDRRAHTYSLKQLEAAETHDPYWNAAMREMRYTGFMHNYMRMYWGKKILEWSRTPKEGFENTLAINNKYFLDGRDPNSFTGVAWVFGIHDRAWNERPVFGKIRYMAASGLERKCDIQGYVKKVERLEKQARE